MAITIPIDVRSRFIGLKSIDYTSRATAGDTTYEFTSRSVQVSVRPIGGKEVAASNGVYVAGDIRIVMPQTALDDPFTYGLSPSRRDQIVPKIGDEFVYDDVTYKVFEVSKGIIAAHTKCVGRNLSIAYALKDTVNLQHPTITSGTQLGKSVSWANVRTGIYCRAQPEADEPMDERGMKGVARRWNVYLDTSTGTGSTFAIKNAAGDLGRLVFGSLNLMIESYEDAERLVDLPVCRCRSVP